ncbi:glycosyltransferase-like domain-containing protein 1 isoform X1 [Patella vulgata]|uniref:glycosyltransferase-like domain-containing protein 1 isoform X1 n=2 Tax=Patella vulgata TaxID=6465 RepID=UPI00217F2822|nr:glycosyltransferase-like domain-containing protein 1 isoform X1 [Patella vulgata]
MNEICLQQVQSIFVTSYSYKLNIMSMANKLIIEPFYGGSHKQLIDLLCREVSDCQLFTLPAKKWHWKARTSSLYLSQVIPVSHKYKVLFASSVLNLSELVALRPDLLPLKKIIYFHENQLVYPVRKQQNRDFQYGYNQILTCLVADVIIFNSKYNMESFSTSINSFLKLIPDHRPKKLEEKIRPKCKVIYFPLKFTDNLSPQSTAVEDLHEKDVTNEIVMLNNDITNETTSPNCDQIGDECEDLIKMEVAEETRISETDNNKITKECMTHMSECQESSIIPQVNIEETNKDDNKEPNLCDLKRQKLDNIVSNSPGDRQCNYSVHLSSNHSDDVNSTDQSVLSYKTPSKVLHILWAHRWEHDKDPDTLFKILYQLDESGLSFNLSVLGEMFTDVPDIFGEAKEKLSSHIINWGYLESKDEYYKVLQQADITVSTALHEFFGVAMLEATYYGCYPLCPNRLVYPEIFPASCLYNTPNQLYKQLKNFCRNPHLVKTKLPKIDVRKFLWENLKEEFMSLFCTN